MTVAVKQKQYSTQDLAAMLSPGMLGLQQENGKPLNLLFRPQQEADPRIKWLLEQSWYSRKLDMGVLRAVPTLEAYNELEDSGIEFGATSRIGDWLENTCYPDIEIVPIREDSPLFDYQKEAVMFLIERKRAMLSLSPGLGKTLTAAYAAGHKGFENVLLVCPASLLYYWKNELEKWSDKLPRKPLINIWHRRIDTDGAERTSLVVSDLDEYVEVEGVGWVASGQTWYITNPETVVRHFDQLATFNFDCLIVDESIMYKHKDSQRSKQLKRMAQEVENVWLLTGAPATRYLDDMWHQFHILNPRGYSSYWRFANKYCVVQTTDWGSSVIANKRDAEKAIQRNFADIYFSRNQDDVLDIPEWIFEDVEIPMQPAQDKVYEKLRKEFLIELGPLHDNEVITATNHLSLMIRSIQVASNPLLVGAVDSSGKWDALEELMEVYPGPHIVWVNFIKSGEYIQQKLVDAGKRVSLANGATSMELRNEMVNAFQAGDTDVIVMNNQVGKFGFTLTKARTSFFVERMYDDSYFQCLHRNRRIGTTQSPIVVNMMSVAQKGGKTLDAVINTVLDYRNGMILAVTAGMIRKVLEVNND